MRKALALLALALPALAQEVTVYPGFAEVKEAVVLPPSAWVYLAGEKLARIPPGSLRLLGVEEEERVYQGTAVLFRYRGEGKATLRYLYTGLSGEVFYTLEEGRLTAWARLRLEGEALEAQRLTLVSGAVSLEAQPAPGVALRALAEAPQGSPFGLFRYELPPRRLLPGTTELPFQKAEVRPERLLRLAGPFRTDRFLPLERGYRFQAPFPLAPGLLEAVEGGLFLGQAPLPPTPRGEVAEVWLGQDLEARLLRSVRLLSQTDKEATYQVETRLENPYPYPVTLLLSETFPQPFRLDLPGATLLPQGYRLELGLKAKEARTLTYRLTLPR
ncbi:MAG: DUF4139 domain-containing protein [Thermus sp.]|uniref:hypothetical protein n=1 Tax=Thermus sp. TaxID=275 RepID=UPI0025F783B9|nr:hypothetical protein [Thermus sp.]MCS6869621.1 DUF4139 domain-containing protein [Thermus sp.]MCS7217441.1 DUF4139 domain-containing protein [Thermus sp.]MCX7848786.1 DUF4139 domain-containing protein [Thermus sp.]MDW8016678.1 hypothetical protein [Thermus sp.]MDW8358140.1 hypothetical protein [Thermus sp.]